MEWQHEIKDPRVFLNSLKIDLYPDEVYAFTPKGEVFAFPRGATPLDFAYRIHTDVGHHCVGARVNGKLVPLRTPLKNGDIVEILTGADADAEPRVAQHGRHLARQAQDPALAEHRAEASLHRARAEADRAGGQALQGAVAEAHRRERARRRADRVRPAAARRPLRRRRLRQDRGALDRRALRHRRAEGEAGADEPGVIQQAVRKIFPFTVVAATIKVKGYDDLLTYLAKCCNPLPGEPIIGYVTRGKGVAVHSANCPNVKNLMFNPDREIGVEWADQRQSQFQVELEIVMEDRQGILARVVSTIANLKTNIRQMDRAPATARPRRS